MNKETIIITTFAFLAILVAFTLNALPKGEWTCTNLICDEQLSPQDWAEDNCLSSVNGTFCQVEANGEKMLIPYESLDFSQFQVCQAWNCTQEAYTRDVNYRWKQ